MIRKRWGDMVWYSKDLKTSDIEEMLSSDLWMDIEDDLDWLASIQYESKEKGWVVVTRDYGPRYSTDPTEILARAVKDAFHDED